MKLHSNNGFTLVETLVTGVIAAIIASSVFVAYIAYDRRARESIAYLKMQRQYDNAVERITFDVRSSQKVKPAGEQDNVLVKSISMIDQSGATRSTFSITAGDTLWQNGAPLNVGGGHVVLATGSGFKTYTERNGVEVQLKIKTKDRNNIFFELPLRREFFRCRQ